MADSKKSLQGYRHRHKNRSTHANIGKRVEEMGEGNCVDINSDFKSSDCVVDPSTDDIESVEESESNEELVETVA